MDLSVAGNRDLYASAVNATALIDPKQSLILLTHGMDTPWGMHFDAPRVLRFAQRPQSCAVALICEGASVRLPHRKGAAAIQLLATQNGKTVYGFRPSVAVEGTAGGQAKLSLVKTKNMPSGTYYRFADPRGAMWKATPEGARIEVLDPFEMFPRANNAEIVHRYGTTHWLNNPGYEGSFSEPYANDYLIQKNVDADGKPTRTRHAPRHGRPPMPLVGGTAPGRVHGALGNAGRAAFKLGANAAVGFGVDQGIQAGVRAMGGGDGVAEAAGTVGGMAADTLMQRAAFGARTVGQAFRGSGLGTVIALGADLNMKAYEVNRSVEHIVAQDSFYESGGWTDSEADGLGVNGLGGYARALWDYYRPW